jgi:Protein of unknown function (DUF1761)
VLGNLNYLAVIAAAVASFIFGGIWYNAFSKQWLEAVGRSPDSVGKEKAGIGLYLLAFGAVLIMAWMLAGVLLHLSLGGMALSLRSGIISALFLWFGFVMTTMVVNYAFHGARQSLTLIDGGHWLGVLVIQGGILGWWGVK